MNWLRSIVVKGGGPGGDDGDGNLPVQSAAPRLSLPVTSAVSSDLVRLRSEFFNYELLEDEKAKSAALPPLLVLFVQVFCAVTPDSISALFGTDALHSFSLHVARCMVREIRQRASSASTEAAARALLHFLANQDGLGGLCLQVLALLAAVGAQTVQAMASMMLPSTLIKTLYLFFDLPPRTSDGEQPGADALNAELHDQFQRRFERLLVLVCCHVAATTELRKSHDLARLFDMLISHCPVHNRSWRAVVAQVLPTVLCHGLNEGAVAYMHDKGCVARCVASLQSTDDYSPREVVNILTTVFTAVKESSRLSHALLDDFRTCHGYAFLTEFILRVETVWTEPAAQHELETLVRSINQLVVSGVLELKPTLGKGSPFQDPFFKVPKPRGANVSVRNMMAFHILHSVFLKATTETLSLTVLDAVFEIFTNDPANYFLLESQHTLALFLERIVTQSVPLQERVFKLLEYVVCTLNYVPFPELVALSIILKQSTTGVICLALRTLIKFINFDAKYSDICREVGIFDVLISRLLRFANELKELQAVPVEPQPSVTQVEATSPGVHFLLMECLALLLSDNSANAELFRVAGGARAVYNMIPWTASRHTALRVVQQLVMDDSHHAHDDLSTLLEVMQSTPPSSYGVKIDILRTIVRLFSLDKRIKSFFREVQGFVYVISTLMSLADDRSSSNMFPQGSREDMPCSGSEAVAAADPKLELIRTIFETLTAAFQDNVANREIFQREGRYEMLANSIRLSGLIASPYANEVFSYLFSMAAETFGREHDVQHPDDVALVNAHALLTVVSLLPITKEGGQRQVLGRLCRLLERESNAYLLASCGMAGALLAHYAETLSDAQAPLYPVVLGVIKQLGMHHLNAAELRAFFRLAEPLFADRERVPIEHLRALVAMTLDPTNNLGAPCIEFDMTSKGHASLFVPAIARLPRTPSTPQRERSWPPAGGFTLCLWLRIQQYGIDSHPVRLFSIFSPSDPELTFFSLHLDPVDFNLILSTTESLRLSTHTFRPGEWTHLALVLAKPRGKQCHMGLYIDGVCTGNLKVPYVGSGPAQAAQSDIQSLVCVRVGTSPRDRSPSNLVWRLGSTLLLDDVLASSVIAVMHQLGPTYTGNYQGSLAHLQHWACSPDIRHHSSKDAGHEREWATGPGIVLTPDNYLDLSTLPVPLINEDRIVLSLQSHAVCPVSVEEAMEPMGGRIAARAFARETQVLDTASIIPSLRNAVTLAPPALVSTTGSTTASTLGGGSALAGSTTLVVTAASVPPFGHLVGAANTFLPRGVAVTLDQIGGVPVVFKLIADAQSTDYLCTAVTLFVLVVKQCPRNAREVERLNGYQVLGGILSHKQHILSADILDLVLGLTSPTSLGSGGNSGSGAGDGFPLINAVAFRELVFDYEVWRRVPDSLGRQVFARVRLLVAPSRFQTDNISVLRGLNIVSRYLNILREETTPILIATEIISVLTALFTANLVIKDIQRVAHSLLTTLHRHYLLLSELDTDFRQSRLKAIHARNLILQMLVELLKKSELRKKVSEYMLKVMGVDFLLQFLEPTLDVDTVVYTTKILALLLSDVQGPYFAKFKIAHGFFILAELLPHHAHVEELYFLLLAMLLGRSVEDIPHRPRLQLSNLHEVFRYALKAPVDVAIPEIYPVLLALVQAGHVRFALVQQPDSPSPFNQAAASPSAASPNPPDRVLSPSTASASACSSPVTLERESHRVRLKALQSLARSSTGSGPQVGGASIEGVSPASSEPKSLGTDSSCNDEVILSPSSAEPVTPTILTTDHLFAATLPRSKPANPFRTSPQSPTALSPNRPGNPFTREAPVSPAGMPPSIPTLPSDAPASSSVLLGADAPTSSSSTVTKPLWSTPWPTKFKKLAPVRAVPPNPFLGSTPAAVCAATRSSSSVVSSPITELDPFNEIQGCWYVDYPAILLKYLLFLFNKSASFEQLCWKSTSLVHLVRILFVPLEGGGEPKAGSSRAETASPVDLGGAVRWTPGEDALSSKRDADVASSALCLHHPNASAVLDFLRDMVLKLLQQSKEKDLTAFEAVLDACPVCPEVDAAAFQARLVGAVLEQLQATSALATLPQPGARLVVNLAKMICIVTDRACAPGFESHLRAILVLYLQILSQATDETGKPYPFAEAAFGAAALHGALDVLLRGSNRLLLALLVVPEQPADVMATHLRLLLENQALFLGEGNGDVDFLLCLSALLLRFLSAPQATVSNLATELWQVVFQRKTKYLDVLVSRSSAPLDISVIKTVPLAVERLKQYLEEPLAKAWAAYELGEARSLAAVQAHLSRRGSRLAKHEKQRKSGGTNAYERHVQSTQRIVRAHKMDRAQRSRWRHKMVDQRRFVYAEWERMDNDLHRERGLFGPESPSTLDKWMLDTLEGPARMRKKMRPNPTFYQLYPFVPEPEAVSVSETVLQQAKRRPTSHDSEDYYWTFLYQGPREGDEQTHGDITADGLEAFEVAGRTHTAGQIERSTEAAALDTGGTSTPSYGGDNIMMPSKALGSDRWQRGMSLQRPAMFGSASWASRRRQHSLQLGSSLTSEDMLLESELTETLDEEDDEPAVMRLLEPGDSVRSKTNAARVSGLDTMEGTFFMCDGNVYFLAGYALSSRGKLQVLPSKDDKCGYPAGELILKWSYEDIKEVLRRRYCLQERGIEIFSADGNNSLIVFNDPVTRDAVYSGLLTMATTLAETPEESVAGVQRDAKIEKEGIFSSFMGGKSLTQRWENGELTNFQYLMHLNTLAGRSYNDLNQYPVFPWIIADYDSEVLDLSDACSYRDLSKPMGAQTPLRAQAFAQRYNTWEDVTEDKTPPFHYGTHYSSAAIVSSYLVRMEPFTQLFLKLQGGHFDHPDRMFYSIKDAWLSASEKNNGDVKELIPEFFYLPEFLNNTNHFDLGTKQSGQVLHDVLLPPWAKGNPHEFVRLHREALESEYVSSRLHEWIDLVFGHKQQGEEARKALNVFHHLTYEGAVDLDTIDDPVERHATISIINNFGQTPKQLFKRPHPPRRAANRMDLGTTISRMNSPDKLITAAAAVKEIDLPVGDIVMDDKDRLFVAGRGQLLVPPLFSRRLSWQSANDSLVSSTVGPEKDVSVYEGLHVGPITVAVTSNNRMLITGGVDMTVRIWSTQAQRGRTLVRRLILRKTFCGHLGPVTALALASTYNILVSGSEDKTAIVWDLTRLQFVRQLQGHIDGVCAVAVNNLTGDIVTCSRDAVYLWDINGQLLATSSKVKSVGSQITCCAISELSEWADDQLIVTGHQDGHVQLWSVDFVPWKSGTSNTDAGWQRQLRQCVILPTHSVLLDVAAVTVVHISSDYRKLLVGDVRGRVYQWVTPDATGRTIEHWVKDSLTSTCMGDGCGVRFSFAERRHHCRHCGKVFCAKCSNKESYVPKLNITKLVRVCDGCYEVLQQLEPPSAAPGQ